MGCFYDIQVLPLKYLIYLKYLIMTYRDIPQYDTTNNCRTDFVIINFLWKRLWVKYVAL